MPVCSPENHRIIRRNLVEVPARRKHRRRPESFNPATARDPFPRLCLIDSGFYLREKILEIGDSFEVQRHLAKANALQVVMRIGQPRHHCRPVQIHDSRIRALIFLHVGVRAHENDPVALYHDGFRPGLFLISRVDVGIGKD